MLLLLAAAEAVRVAMTEAAVEVVVKKGEVVMLEMRAAVALVEKRSCSFSGHPAMERGSGGGFPPPRNNLPTTKFML